MRAARCARRRRPPRRPRPSRISSSCDGRVEADLAARGDDLVGHRLPHLAGAEARVVELADQRLDLVALVAEERGLGGGGEGQALDPLGRPLRAQLGRRHAPHLLGVGLEEVLVEPLAEAVGDPLLDVLLLALGLDLRPQVGEAGADELDRAELLDRRPCRRADSGGTCRSRRCATCAGGAGTPRCITSCQRSSTSLDLVKKRCPPRSKR